MDADQVLVLCTGTHQGNKAELGSLQALGDRWDDLQHGRRCSSSPQKPKACAYVLMYVRSMYECVTERERERECVCVPTRPPPPPLVGPGLVLSLGGELCQDWGIMVIAHWVSVCSIIRMYVGTT